MKNETYAYSLTWTLNGKDYKLPVKYECDIAKEAKDLCLKLNVTIYCVASK